MKDIEGYEGLYAVTEDGKVWDYERQIYRKQHVNKKGYSIVSFSKNNKQHQFYVHRLVALSFLPNPNNLPFVCHKVESEILDNSVDNLWWGSPKDNTLDCIKKGRFKHLSTEELILREEQRKQKIKDELNKRSQLEVLFNYQNLRSNEVKEKIRNLTNYHGLLTDVARIFGVSKEAIRKIRHLGK